MPRVCHTPRVRAGRWELVRSLGRGGMAEVWLGRDPASGEEAAVKLVRPDWLADEEGRARFQREARLLRELQLPGLVRWLEEGEDARGTPWIAMELLPGGTLAARVAQRGPLPPREAAALGRDLARTLGEVHARGVLHRDLKPGNVLFDAQGRAHLTDLGLARHRRRGGSLTGEGDTVGTPGYLAPEQVLGEKDRLGPPSDVYGLGATLYFALTGELPIDLTDDVMAIYRDRPLPPSQRRPGLPADLDALCLRCLEKSPDDRYASAAELAAALDAFLAGGRAPLPQRRRARGWGWLLAAGCAAGLIALAARPAAAPAPAPPPAPVGPPPRVDPTPTGPSSPAEVQAALERARELEERSAAWSEALAALDLAARRAGRDPSLLARVAAARAGYLLRRGDAAAALQAARTASGPALELLAARALLRLERREEALRTLGALEGSDPGPEGRVAGALLRHLRGQDRAGLALAEQALAQDGHDPRALEAQGLCLYGLGEHARAIAALQAAVAAAPADPLPRGALAMVLLAAGRPEEAWSALEAAVQRGEPRPPAELLRLRGVQALRLMRPAAAALLDLERALGAETRDAEGLFWRGVAKLRLRAGAGGAAGAEAALEATPAEQDLARALALDPAAWEAGLLALPEGERAAVAAVGGSSR